MKKQPVTLDIPAITHGYGLSFKKGLCDALLDAPTVTKHPKAHESAYQQGSEIGKYLEQEIAKRVKP